MLRNPVQITAYLCLENLYPLIPLRLISDSPDDAILLMLLCPLSRTRETSVRLGGPLNLQAQ